MDISEIRLGPIGSTENLSIAAQELADKTNELIRNLLELAAQDISWDDLSGEFPQSLVTHPEGSGGDFLTSTQVEAMIASATEGFISTTDVRLSNSRTPLSHGPSHYENGSDPLDLDNIAGELDASKLYGNATLNSLYATVLDGSNGYIVSFQADDAAIASMVLSSTGIDLFALSTTAQVRMPINAVVSTNFNADKLDDEHGPHYLDRTNHTGTQNISTLDPGAEYGVLSVNAGLPSWGLLMNDNVAGAAAIAWSKLDKIGAVAADVGAASAADLSTHEADTTNVHGIADTSQVALKNTANTFTVAPQTLSGNAALLRLTSTGSGVSAQEYIEFRQSEGRTGYIGDGFGSARALGIVADAGFPIQLQISSARALTIDANLNVEIGTAALATTATDGFLYEPTCPGPPTGVPTAKSGRTPRVIDSVNLRVYYYLGGAWHYSQLI